MALPHVLHPPRTGPRGSPKTGLGSCHLPGGAGAVPAAPTQPHLHWWHCQCVPPSPPWWPWRGCCGHGCSLVTSRSSCDVTDFCDIIKVALLPQQQPALLVAQWQLPPAQGWGPLSQPRHCPQRTSDPSRGSMGQGGTSPLCPHPVIICPQPHTEPQPQQFPTGQFPGVIFLINNAWLKKHLSSPWPVCDCGGQAGGAGWAGQAGGTG